jgi:hypothetical protein
MKLRQRQLREGLQRLEAQFEQGADLCLLVGDLNLSKVDETSVCHRPDSATAGSVSCSTPLTETTRGIYT